MYLYDKNREPFPSYLSHSLPVILPNTILKTGDGGNKSDHADIN